MSNAPHRPFGKIPLLAALLLIGSAAWLPAQAGWKTGGEKGFSFVYPNDWNCVEIGGKDFVGTQGYVTALSPPAEANFAIIVILFPGFNFDLQAEKVTFEDFIKIFFEGALEGVDQKGVKIEKTEAAVKHGPVPAFMAVAEESAETFKASLICGDLVKTNAAMIMVTMNLTGESAGAGKEYLEQAERIMASFAFPE